MNSSDHLCLKHKSTRPTFARGLRLSLVLAVICFCGLQTARAQTSYSDLWVVDAPDGVQTAPGENAEPPVNLATSDNAQLASTGITESNYTNYNTYRTKATLKSPSGIASSSTGTWGSYSRADTSMNVSLGGGEYMTNHRSVTSITEEGDYVLETEHTESEGSMSGGEYMTNHSSKTKYGGPSKSAATPKPGIISWIKRVLASIRFFKQVYKYSSTLQVSGMRTLYYYTFVCQNRFCYAESVKTFTTDHFGAVPPPYAVIRGIKVTIAGYHICKGWPRSAYYQESCY